MRNTHTATRGERVTAKQGQETQGNDTVETRYSEGVRDLMVREQRDDTCEKGERVNQCSCYCWQRESPGIRSHTHTHTREVISHSACFIQFPLVPN